MPGLETLLTRLLDSEVRFVVFGGFAAVAQQSEDVPLGDAVCRILTIDALISAKEAMGRPKDHEMVIQLKAIREKLQGE